MDFTQTMRNAVRAAEVHRGEAQRLYNYAARTLKGFSVGVYNRFMDFVAQDENVILALKGILAEMEMNVESGPEKNKVTVTVIPIVGLGELPGESDSKESGGRLLANFCESLIEHENLVMKTYVAMQEELPESFKSFFSERLSIEGLVKISSDRMRVLAKLSMWGKKMFGDRPENFSWRCSYCGFVTTGSAAPDECPCCYQPKSWFETGDWFVMRTGPVDTKDWDRENR